MKAKLISMILISALLVGCHRQTLEITEFIHEPINVKIFYVEAEYQRTYIVSHRDGIVSTLKIIDKVVFDSGDVEVMSAYDELNDTTYSSEIFEFEGFSQSSEIQKNIYISTIILEYRDMNMKELIESENWFINAKNLVNEDLEVEYDKLKTLILEDGCEEVE